MWFYAKDGEQHGPVEADDLRSRLRAGELSNETLVWKEGMAQWLALGQVLELREPVPSSGETAAPMASEAQSSSPTPQASVAASDATPQPKVAPQLVAPVQQNTMALVSMILGITSIVLCLGALTGIPAIICGHISRKQFRESPVPQSGEGMAIAGLILGYLMTIFSIAYIVFMILVFWGASTNNASSVPLPTTPPAATPVPAP